MRQLTRCLALVFPVASWWKDIVVLYLGVGEEQVPGTYAQKAWVG